MLSWGNLPHEAKERLAELYREGGDYYQAALGYNLNINKSTLKRRIQEYLHYRSLFAGAIAVSFPIPTNPPNDDYIIIEHESAVVISDIEIPDQDPWMLYAALLVGQKRGIKTLIYNGDVIATDQEALNSWAREWREAEDTTLNTVVRLTRRVIESYATWFSEQFLVSGNHDKRLNRKTGGEVFLEMLLYDTPVEFSRHTYMYMKTSRGWVFICHPKNYSVNAASTLGRSLWAKTISPEGTKCHVVLGHTHLAQTAWSPDGQQELVSTGCMRSRALYKDLEVTTHPQWQRGFVVIDHGYFYPMTEYGTDWKRELGGFYPMLVAFREEVERAQRQRYGSLARLISSASAGDAVAYLQGHCSSSISVFHGRRQQSSISRSRATTRRSHLVFRRHNS